MDSRSCLLIFVTLLYLDVAMSVKLPPSYDRCIVSPELDNKPNECLRKAITKAIQELTDNGTPELGALDLDPMQIDYIKIQRGKDSPVAITLVFKNNTMSGIGGFNIQEVNGKFSSPQGFHCDVHATTPSIVLAGPYKISGKVLILPIEGEGLSNMTLRHIKVRIIIDGEPKMKNGKEYLNITTLKISMDIGRLYMSLGNLFNGNAEVGDRMNSFINQNWKDIYGELRPSIEEAFASVFREYARRIFNQVAFADIFIVQ